MFDIWMVLVPGGILALLVGVGLVIPKKSRKAGLVVGGVGAALLCTGVLRAWHRNNVVMSVAKTHQQVQAGMSKAEVEALVGEPDLIASADATGKLQVPWKSYRDRDIPEAVLAWEYRPYDGLHFYRVYFDSDGRVIGDAIDVPRSQIKELLNKLQKLENEHWRLVKAKSDSMRKDENREPWLSKPSREWRSFGYCETVR